MAMGLCLSSLTAPVLAQSVTGAVAGRAQAGAQITITNESTGLSRTVTVGSDGTYRIAQLAPGNYTVTAGGAPVAVNVSVGGTTTVNLSSGGAVELDTVQVVGARVVNRVDVYSTESATNINREEIARLPVDQNLASVALLAPGVVNSGATFGGLTFGGSTVAENAIYINGLNVTDLYLRRGFSEMPFGFFEEFQVKTGGYSAEFGRSTGGVLNAVTRSGGNEFEGGVELTFEPSSWSSQEEDRPHGDGTFHNDRMSRDDGSFYKANVWGSGPILKDRLFFFAMYELRDFHSQDLDTSAAFNTQSKNDFWGLKLDWHLNENHLLELLAFSDLGDSTTKTSAYNFSTDTHGVDTGEATTGSGGDNWSLTYTGHFTDNFTAKALYGVNERRAIGSSPWDDVCSSVARSGDPNPGRPGCHPTNLRVSNRWDEREASRLDFEWTLGDHLLRFGWDQEIMNSDSLIYNPGSSTPGEAFAYTVQAFSAGGVLANGTPAPPGTTAIIDARRYLTGSPIETKAQAFYIEDNWSVTPNLLLQIGVRADMFHNKLASGGTFTKSDFGDMISPRLGFSWDVKGDGTTKLFGNAGRYYLPLTNKLADAFGGGILDEHTYYVFNGWSQQVDPINGTPYQFPIFGPQIGPINTESNAPAPTDVSTVVARDLEMVYQDEYIVGFQQAIDQAWSYGINATYRKVSNAVEDVRINHLPGCPGYSEFPILNPGEVNTLFCEATGEYVTFDSAVDGYIASGSGAISGYKKPERTYKAVEFQLDRAWDDKWAFNASYLWSKSEGNIEGPVNSDLGYADTNLVQFYDHPAVNERYGVLFNDHRHQIKLRGSYALNDIWSFGGTVSAVSGGPITAFGVRWPNDNRGFGPGEFSGGGSGWLCLDTVLACSGLNRVLTPTERGAFGRLPWVTDLGASVTFTLPKEDIDLKARFSIYNLLDNQAAINVHSRYESAPGVKMPYFGQATRWQSPRWAQLVITYNF
jgi:outer membrane receptor for ferrienterochelin and colicin